MGLRQKTDDRTRTVSLLLLRMRDDAGVTQATWATWLGISQRLVVNWEQRYRIPTRTQAYAIVAELRDRDVDPGMTLEFATLYDIHADIVGISLEEQLPRPTTEDTRARLSVAIYEAAEDAAIPAHAVRGAVLAVLEAAMATRATVVEARDAVASIRTRKGAPST